MKGPKLIIILMLFPMWSWAQTETVYLPSEGYTLEECIDYALKNAIDVKNARLDEEIAEARVRETIGIGLPQVTGNVSLDHNGQLRRFYATKQQAYGFSGMPEDQYGNFLPGVGDEDIVAAENFFQLKNSGDAGLSVNQLIFNGSYIVGLQASQAYKDLAIKSHNQTEEEVRLNVSKAYYTLLINRERAELYESNINRVDSLHYNTLQMYKNGFSEKIDVDRIQVTLNNLITERDNFNRLVKLSERLLKFQMNYPLDQDITIAGSIQSNLIQSEISQDESWDYSARPDYQVLQANYKLQGLNVRNKMAEALPVISAYANLGYATQSPTFGGLFTTESGFEEQESLGIGPDKWYGYNSVGLKLSWSLFTGLQRANQIQQEKLELLKIENTFKSTEKSIELDIQQSQINYDDAVKRLEVQKENRDLAEEIYQVATAKYQNGVGSNLEVIDAENSLKQAEINYYNTLYDAVIAQLELKKALGLLNQ